MKTLLLLCVGLLAALLQGLRVACGACACQGCHECPDPGIGDCSSFGDSGFVTTDCCPTVGPDCKLFYTITSSTCGSWVSCNDGFGTGTPYLRYTERVTTAGRRVCIWDSNAYVHNFWCNPGPGMANGWELRGINFGCACTITTGVKNWIINRLNTGMSCKGNGPPFTLASSASITLSQCNPFEIDFSLTFPADSSGDPACPACTITGKITN